MIGGLGVGKTFVSSVIINELTGNKLVSSPTFNLVKTYFVNNKLEIWHCDFYRLANSTEIEEIGIFDKLKSLANEKIDKRLLEEGIDPESDKENVLKVVSNII